MTTDFENELRDLFREKAGEAPLAAPTLPASAPQRVLRRGRLHQVGTVLGSAVVVVALIVGSVAGLTRIVGEGDDIFGSDNYEVFQRTATVEAFTVASPSNWYLVNEWPSSMLIAVEGSGGSSSTCAFVPGAGVEECEDTASVETSSPIPVPYGLPMLQLSNVDLGLSANVCADGVPEDGAALYVALDYDAAIAGIADPSIQEFPPGTGLPPEGDGPCGPGRYEYFTVNGERFFSWIGVGSDASDEDRETVETSYEMMSAIPDWTPTPPNETTPAYVIAGGDHGPGDDWRIELRPSGDAIQLSLEGGPAPDVLLTDGSAAPVSWTGTDPIFGAITKAATGVEFRPTDAGDTIPGTIMPLPPSLPFDLDLFVIEGTVGLIGEVVALGVDQPSLVSPPPISEPRDEVVKLSGTFEGRSWSVRFTGSFAERNPCIRVTLADVYEPLCVEQLETSLAGAEPSMHIWATNELALFAGAVPPTVQELVFFDQSGREVAIDYECRMGPLGWTDPDRKVCAIALPPEGSGTLRYNDANGVNLFLEDMGWGSAEADMAAPVDPLHGGTYWAVYPWVGPTGDPAANAMVGHLFDQFGIQAIQGEVGCDQGAAEALGTDVEWRVAVYFDTRGDAQAFADQLALSAGVTDVQVAQVTTNCLD